MFLKKGFKVKVLSGKDKGKVGKVLKVIFSKKLKITDHKPNRWADKNIRNSKTFLKKKLQTKAIVEGVNIVKKHTKQSATSKGGIESIEKPIYISKLSVQDPKSTKPSRVGFKLLDDGKKVRFLKKSGETLT